MNTVLIIDDSDINLTLIRALVLKLGDCQPVVFENPLKALEWCHSNVPDLVIVDYMMPEMDGLKFIAAFRALHGRNEIPVVMITANDQRDIRYDALLRGANDFLTKPIDRIEFSARARNMLSLRNGQKFLADRAEHLAALVDERTSEIREREKELIFRMSRAAEFRDPETGAHIQRMAHFSAVIARGLDLDDQDAKAHSGSCAHARCRQDRHPGCAVPVAWKILPATEKPPWQPEWLALLKHFSEVVPPGWTVIILTDRGLYAKWLFQAIPTLGWHPLLRINPQGTFRPQGWYHWVPLTQRLPAVGRSFASQGTAFHSQEAKLECTLLGRWDAGHQEAWLMLTDLSPQAADVGWYGLRAWIGQGFKRLKRGGLAMAIPPHGRSRASTTVVARAGLGHLVAAVRRR